MKKACLIVFVLSALALTVPFGTIVGTFFGLRIAGLINPKDPLDYPATHPIDEFAGLGEGEWAK